ncbi:MAG: YbhB/YbcL family Raf kinase inhibitor-like protein [Candidatus Omnitrophica bacterium]|nr:YbhB/YbcL family Raf kinase inhibitor-like protein [Candidatus Omnitrophota bacterium]
MRITSPAFEHEGTIPFEYTCNGKDINPPLGIEEVPNVARSLALVVDDPDAPNGDWVHWVVFNISPETPEIAENSVPGEEASNDFDRRSYGGPCPPSGTHRYFFRLYALDTELDPEKVSGRHSLEKEMEGHIVARSELMGKYGKE